MRIIAVTWWIVSMDRVGWNRSWDVYWNALSYCRRVIELVVRVAVRPTAGQRSQIRFHLPDRATYFFCSAPDVSGSPIKRLPR
jgi:hypothetical protein